MILKIIKLLVTFVALLVVVTLVVLSVSASWIETAVVSNNQILSGTTDLQLSTAGIGGGGWQRDFQNSLLTLDHLVPGVTTDDYYFSLRNNSSTGINFDVFVRVTAITGVEGVDETNLLLNLYENGSSPDSGSHTSGWVSLIDLQATAHTLNSQLVASEAKDYRLAAKLNGVASEAWQGKTVVITLTVTGQQF